MPTVYKRIRLACDVQNPTRCINELTGQLPILYLTDSIIFEVALFQDDALIQAVDLDSINFSLADPTNPIAESVTNFSSTLTAAQWRAGTAYSFAVHIESATMASLTAGTRALRIEMIGADGQHSDAVFADVVVASLGPITVTAAPTPAPSYYNKTESDARFPAIARMSTAESNIVDLQAESKVLYSVQTLTAPQKTQACANIGAARVGTSQGTGWVVAGAGALVFADYQMWFETLIAATALTATGTPTYNVPYIVNLAQDATGGFNVTWPAGYSISPAALMNPKPSTSTAFKIESKRITGAGTLSTIEPLALIPSEPEPSFRFDTRAFARITPSTGTLATGSLVDSIADIYSGRVATFTGTKATYQQTGMIIGPALSCGGAGGYFFGTTAASIPMDTTIPDGFTIAMVFDSRSASDCCMMNLGPLGLGLFQRGGNLEFGSRSVSGNRVAVPFTANDSTATVAIFTYLAGGTATGIVIKNGVAAKVSYSAAAAAGTTLAATWELFQNNGAERFTGYVSHVALHDRALSWEQQQALALKLCADFGIVPTV